MGKRIAQNVFFSPMADILEANGISIDVAKLSARLGLTVVRISAKTGEGIGELISTIRDNKYLRNSHLKIYAEDVQKEIDHIEGDLNHELEEAHNPKFAAVKVFERDPYFHALSNSSTEDEVRAIEANYNMDEIGCFCWRFSNCSGERTTKSG